MAIVFAVFLVALLAVFLRPEGRADRFARASALASSAAKTSRTLFSRGSDVVDRVSADLARDESQPGGLDVLLGPPEPAPVTPAAE
ncbi:MAG: hypothetical protein ACR2FU_07415 [Streptosporangiaceae bacterium]